MSCSYVQILPESGRYRGSGEGHEWVEEEPYHEAERTAALRSLSGHSTLHRKRLRSGQFLPFAWRLKRIADIARVAARISPFGDVFCAERKVGSRFGLLDFDGPKSVPRNRRTNTRLTAVTSASLILYLGCMTAAAHHSGAAYDPDNETVLEGTVVGLDVVNPHSYVRLGADDGAGGTVAWQVEGPSRITAMRNGVNEDTLPIGARISVEVRLNRDPSKYEVRGRRITKEDGSFLWLNGGPREQQEATAPGFSGMWEPKSSSTVARNFDYDNTNVGPTTWSLTPAGRDALERYHNPTCLNTSA